MFTALPSPPLPSSTLFTLQHTTRNIILYWGARVGGEGGVEGASRGSAVADVWGGGGCIDIGCEEGGDVIGDNKSEEIKYYLYRV